MNIGISTENIYKFCATLGLTFTLFNFYYSSEIKYEANKEYLQFVGDTIYHDNLVKQFKHDTTQLNKLLISAENIQKFDEQRLKKLIDFSINSNETNIENENILTDLKREVKHSQESVQQLYKEKILLIGSLMNSTNEIRTKTQLIKISQRKAYKYFWVLLIGTIIGIGLMFYGFKNWIKLECKT